MALEKHMLQTHSLFEKAGEVFEGVAKLKERIVELEKENEELREQRNDLFSQGVQAKFDFCGEKLKNKRLMRGMWLLFADLQEKKADEIYAFNFITDHWCADVYRRDYERKLLCAKRCREKAEEYK